jgi:hypothetical protein
LEIVTVLQQRTSHLLDDHQGVHGYSKSTTLAVLMTIDAWRSPPLGHGGTHGRVTDK